MTEDLKELQMAYDYWSQYKTTFVERDHLEETAVELRKPLPKKSLILFFIYLVFWIVPVTCLFGLFAFYCFYFHNISAAFVVLAIMIVLDFPAFIPIFYRIHKTRERENDIYNNGLRQNSVSDKIDHWYSEYRNNTKCPLPRKYVKPDYIKTIADLIASGKADSIDQAIDMFENENVLNSK